MTVQIENEFKDKFDFSAEELIEQVVEYCVDYVKCPYEAEVNVIITDNEDVHAINKEYRDIDRTTDVLSFPMLEFESPEDFSVADGAVEDYFNPETGELILGDIIISYEKVKEQAKEYGHSERRELAFLVAHSMLHLAGYDHIEDLDRVVMEAKQDEILTELGITRQN